MLHYQFCVTCLPHSRLPAPAFFISALRFTKFCLKSRDDVCMQTITEKMIWLTVDPNQKKENALIKGSGRARELHEAWKKKKKDVLVSLWAWTFVGKNFLTAEQTAPLHRSQSVFSLSAGLGCKTTFFHAWPETVLSPNTEACSLEDRAGRRRGTLLMCKHPVRGSALI